MTQAEAQFSVYIEGVRCAKCVQKLESLSQNPEVLLARFKKLSRTLDLRLARADKISRILDEITKLGFAPFLLPGQKAVSQSTHARRENRMLLLRTAVAGFCAGNMMLFTIPIYSGAEGLLRDFFNAITAVLFLPVFFFSAGHFFKGGWSALIKKEINIDLLISISFLLGSVYSLYQWLNGSAEIYFDSTASFIFLILCTRYLLKAMSDRWIFADHGRPGWLEQLLRLKSGEQKFAAQLVKGDEVEINTGQIIPVDIELSSHASFDTSLITGESSPKYFQPTIDAIVIPAGYKLITEPIIAKVFREVDKTELASIFEAAKGRAFAQTELSKRLAKVATGLMFVVILTSLFLLLNPNLPFDERLSRAFALIIVACPCALAFGAPLGFALGMRLAEKENVLVHNVDIFERLKKVKKVYFDKTGTLTFSRVHLDQFSIPIEEVESKISPYLVLESQSQHPIAFALRERFLHRWRKDDFSELSQITEIPGYGVTGFKGADFFEVKSAIDRRPLDLSGRIGFFKNGILEFSAQVREDIDPEAQSVVNYLKSRNLALAILSGDEKNKVEYVARSLGIRNFFGKLSPTQKAEVLIESHKALTVGDGVNDLLALQKSFASLAMGSGLIANARAADASLGPKRLGAVVILFQISDRVIATLRTNIGISLIYNAILGGLAIHGSMSPLLAAVLMPVNSAIMILISFIMLSDLSLAGKKLTWKHFKKRSLA